MKIFLGVLETDVVNEDVGLSDIDPRRLAAGEWEEVVFIAKLLCWLGKQTGLLPSKHNSSARLPRGPSSAADGSAESRASITFPSTRSTTTNSINSTLSFDREYQESDTTLQSMHSDVTEIQLLGDERLSGRMDPRHLPRCIHEIEDPSFLAQTDEGDLLRAEHGSLSCDTDDTVDAYCDCSSSVVRYDGYIQEVDAGVELRTFEARKKTKPLHAYSGPEMSETPSMSRHSTETRQTTRHTSPSQHALALLDERAKLLSRLASLDINIANTFSGKS
jgi:hypothetical protein